VVASAENIGACSSATAGTANQRTPVAHEVAVVATGARPGADAGKRELFTENTTTALVFPSGGVIALAAAVEPGQLLFLTNQQTKREVVAQVTRKRTNPSTGYYVELEFTEPAPDFWGIAFPEAAEAAPDPHRPTLAELLQAAEPGANDLSPNAPAPSASDVHALVAEVEALRAQLKLMQSQGVGGKEVESGTVPAGLPTGAGSASATPGSDPVVKLAPALSAVLASMAASAASTPPSAPGTPMPGPGESTAGAATADENLLPKPALDFQKAPKPGAANYGRGTGADRLSSLRLALLAVVSVFAVMVAAWNMHWLPWLAGKPSGADHPPAAPRSTASTAAGKSAIPPTAEARPSSGTVGQTTGSAPPQDTATPTKPENAGVAATAPELPSAPADGAIANESARPMAMTPVVKRSAVHSSTTAEATAGAKSASASDDGPITPPRLIKAARAIAPSEALREFVTGNVTLDALIDKSGEVKAIKVLSGPAIFHKAAMEALKQYRYEPARRNGQPVAAHVTVTIPFWFEP